MHALLKPPNMTSENKQISEIFINQRISEKEKKVINIPYVRKQLVK